MKYASFLLKRNFFVITILSTLSLYAEIPKEAQRLVDSRERAIDKIDEKFIKELEKIKVVYTKKGNLDAANAIVALINSVEDDNTVYSNDNTLFSNDTIEGIWKRESTGANVKFDGNGAGTRNGHKFKVVYDKEKDHFTIRSDTFNCVLSYGPDMKTLEGSTFRGTKVRLKKIK